MSPVDSVGRARSATRAFLLPWYTPVVDEAVEGRALEAHVLAELDVGDPPLADEAADEALPGAQVLGRLADGEQLTGVAEGHVPVGGRRWHHVPPWGCPGHGQRPPAVRVARSLPCEVLRQGPGVPLRRALARRAVPP